jgi:DNA-binding MarR family transcriptional regulator
MARPNKGNTYPSDVDKVIHEPARLLIVAQLYVVEEADFTYLMRQTHLTWGNLSSHMRRLEDENYIEIRKEFAARRPRTVLRLTKKGRSAFEQYCRVMNGLLGKYLS